MKAEINNENKAKFFALYWGQEIQSHRKELFHVTGILISQSWLTLKPLSSISDEDAEFIDLQSEDYNEDGWFDGEGIFYYWASFDVDYLRSKGYALPWMGLSVEEMVQADWIKLTK
jgi:hypothetical protein